MNCELRVKKNKLVTRNLQLTTKKTILKLIYAMQNNKKKKKSIGLLISLVAVVIPWIIIFAIKEDISKSNVATEIKIVNYEKDTLPSQANHKEFEILKQEFTSPEQVTEACISCHNERHTEVMGTSHWNWDRDVIRADGKKAKIGKKNIVNNFCIATNTNTWKCSSCHIGFGYKDKNFDFTDQKKVDCIVCHDNTGTYEKQPLGSGYPVTEKRKFSSKTYFPPNFNYIAQNVGSPEIENCGKCHFFGGGGDNVKHGDLSSDLYHADKAMDVHMDENGNDMTCIECHDTERHQMLGKSYSVSNANVDRMNCEKCHSETPHQNTTLNDHTNKIACQTCHIPVYAKGVSTNTVWDWSTSGRLDKMGKAIKEHDSLGNVTYKSAKGNYEWGTNLEPEYVWFNGTSKSYVYGDIIEDTAAILKLNPLNGSYADGNSKIIPVKIHRGKQIFDPENKMLIIPEVYGHSDTAYHHGFDWNLSSEAGMKEAGLPYSGKYSFIETEMFWPLNHMVAESNKSLTCVECHSKDGRLENVAGFYMPGRDRSVTFDILGVLMVVLALVGVSIHGLIRYIKKDCIACDN